MIGISALNQRNCVILPLFVCCFIILLLAPFYLLFAPFSLIFREYHPFSVVEDIEFKKLVFLLNANYKLPSRKTISSSLIPATYNDTVEIVKKRLERAYAICLTMDGWTSRAQDSFFSVTAHYVVEEEKRTFLASDLLACSAYAERHTGENITKKMNDIFNEWGIFNKVTVVVTDNAANMKAAVRGGGWRHWGCFAHSLNLVAQAGLKEIEPVLCKVKSIVRFFSKSSHAHSKLKATLESMHQPVLKLFNDVPTRWNSTYEMLKRFLVLKDAVITTIALVKSSMPARDEELRTINLLTSEDWLAAEESMKIMELFEIITTLISAEKHVSASSLILYIKQLTKHLKSFNMAELTPTVQKLLTRLLSELNERFKDIELNELIAQATILDPRFKKFGFINETAYNSNIQKLYSRVANTVVQNCENFVIDENPDHCNSVVGGINSDRLELIWKEFDAEVQQHTRPGNQIASAIVEVDKYLSEPVLQRKDSSGKPNDPLVWWHQRKYIYPRLYQLVKKRLCISATSVPCERIFSHAGQLVSEKRESLKASKVSQIVFLNYNLGNNDF